MLKEVEKETATYQKTLSASEVNQAGWKVCHIDPIGLKKRGAPGTSELSEIKDHFIKFMSPSNMFVVPLSHKALGELPEMINAMKNKVSSTSNLRK